MSEKFTTRKGRVRRNVVALLSAVALGVGGVAVPQTAGAWVQQDIERNYGEKPDPVQETNAIFETFKPETMQSDGSYTYTIGGKAKAPKPLPDQNDPDYELKQRGASDILTMTVWVWAATPNTVLEEPTADDFKWASGQTRPFKSIEKVRADDGVYTDQDGNKIGGGDGYKIEFDINAAEDSFTAEIQAKLKADIPAGALVTAATYVETTISPRVIWEHENSWLTTDPNDSDTCAGIAHGRHRLQGGGYGQWMAEMYLGSLNGNLELRGAPRVTFTLPNGDTFSGEESGMTQGDVSSQALDANYKAGFEKLNPNTVWGQKFDWPFDKNTATGKFWLPTGTIFEFEQNVYDKDKPCSDAKWGGDKLHHRAMLTSVNPPIVRADTAQTWFKMPEGEEPCDCELGSVGDKVWIDKNKDGIQDEDETQGVAGVKVVLKDASGKEVARTVTDEDGNWNTNVKPGHYTVVYEPGNNVPTKPEQIERTVTIKPGEKRDDIDLGILPSGSVGDRVWNDANGDGKQDEGEEGLENVVVLVSRDGEPTRSAVTDKDGNWKIEGLNPNAEYDIRFIQPDGWEVTGKVPGSDESGLVSKVTVKPNEYNDTYDLGLRKTDVTCDCEPEAPGTLGDRVWVDTNGNGKEDPDETEGVEGITVIIRDKDGSEVIRTVTDEDGNWKVDVEPGDYTVVYEPGDRVPSEPGQVSTKVTIKPGEKRDDIDLGILPSGSVGDRVWNDANGDGKQDEGEEGLENVVVLVSRDGEPTRSAVTDSNGDWKIEGLNPNAEYDIRFIQPDGWEVTGKVPGSDESGLVSKVTVKPNEYNDTYDLGLKKIETTCDCEPEAPGTLGDKVWVDTNGNGKEDPNETEGVEGVTVIIRDKDGNEVIRTVTDEGGNWKVDVEPGEYTVEYKTRDGYTPTDPSQVSCKVVVESGKEYLDVDLGVKPGEKTPPTPPVTETVTETVPVPTPPVTETVTETVPVPAPPVTETVTETVPVPTTKVEKPNGKTDNGAWERCVANAVASPLLYLVPIAVLGAVGGELARPYMGAINEQLAKVNADIQAAMRRDTPDRGHGGAGRDNDQFADIRAQLDAANRQIQAIGNDPNIQRFGTIALGVLGLVAAGGVLYDWCSNEKGEAFTSIKGGSSEPMPITTAPVTTTPEK
ncbi:SdrD B-like domain-containing protein [Corynebacterium sp. HMSC034B08]|uniref:SdrD B-like domain-containing protein n=2 Tax=unclassified Corynebacterium TaxID=2624378 RepID=UPI000ACE22CD|nr:SdrD B-like domain-containing protein [Corynebacterium sp. HMSC034B08]